MPAIDEEMLGEGIKALIDLDREWVPDRRGTALYIRPTMIADDNALGVRPSKSYLLFVITSPVGSYYTKGTAPTRILVEERYSRAALGGLGEAKTGANYAASLLAAEEAKARGFDQVLWLDTAEHRYVEEVGTMNIFFVIDDVLITPPLGGTILDGITRRTVLELAQSWGIRHEERRIAMDEIAAAHANGTLQEVFGSGTAAVIAPVGELFYKNQSLVIDERSNSLRERFYNTISAIQYGELADEHGWAVPVPHVADRTSEDLEETVGESRTRG
jgi:branched-chain amino acid aminotransferase